MDDLSGNTRQVIADRIASTGELTGDFEKDAAKGLFQEFKPTAYNFGLNAQNDAIANKAKARFYDPVVSGLVAEQKAGYAGDVQKKIKGASQLAMGQLRYDNARAMAARQRVAQEEAQRAAMIGSLFQVAGTVGGFMAGGPPGAAAGNIAGSQLGASTAGAKSSGNPMGHSGPYMNTAGRTA